MHRRGVRLPVKVDEIRWNSLHKYVVQTAIQLLSDVAVPGIEHQRGAAQRAGVVFQNQQ